MTEPNGSTVFVVHGRDGHARNQMFTFLRALSLRPMEWTEAVRRAGTASPYVGQVLDKAFEVAKAVIVLFTPDDLARLHPSLLDDQDPVHEKTPSGQARPNVLFEAGMAMGRDADRTVLVEWGHLRPFSDIGGRHVIRMSNTAERRQELAQRLIAAGCAVDIGNTDWLSAGDFSLEALASQAKQTKSASTRSPKVWLDAQVRKAGTTRYVLEIRNSLRVAITDLSLELLDSQFTNLDNLEAARIDAGQTARFTLTGPQDPPDRLSAKYSMKRGTQHRTDTLVITVL